MASLLGPGEQEPVNATVLLVGGCLPGLYPCRPMRIDIELTSQRSDGSWTWRAANAKQPRGVVSDDLLYSGAAVGHVVRAEAESSIEGVIVLSVAAPTAKAQDSARIERIEREWRDSDFSKVADRFSKPRREGRPESRGEGRAPGRGRANDQRGAVPGKGPRRSAEGRENTERSGQNRPRRNAGAPTSDWRDKGDKRAKAPRHTVRRDHRDAVLAEVPEEHRPIAQLLLVGGLPSVRARLDEQEGSGTPTNREAILTLAEELLPRIRAAEWRDRAEAAERAGDSLPMRELRSIINTADVAGRDDECRQLADRLRGSLRARSEREREKWLAGVRSALVDGRIVRALRESSRPPDAGSRLPADLATALADAASSALTADTNPDRWAAVLEATLLSPVKRQVHPAALPADASADFTTMVGDATGHIPALAKLLGVAMPPPPNPKAAEFAHSFVRNRAAAADPEPSAAASEPSAAASEPSAAAESPAAGDDSGSEDSPAVETAGEAVDSPTAVEQPDETVSAGD